MAINIEVFLKKHNISASREKMIGKGMSSVVYLGRDEAKNRCVAIKELYTFSMQSSTVSSRSNDIKEVTKSVNCKHCVQIILCVKIYSTTFMVLEYADKGNLEDYVKKQQLNTNKLLRLMFHCGKALQALHENFPIIIHGNLKPSNFLLISTAKTKTLVKLSDNLREDVQPGEHAFCAPEHYAEGPFTTATDIFSLGVIFLALISYKCTDEQLICYAEKEGRNKFFIGKYHNECRLKEETPERPAFPTAMDTEAICMIKTIINDVLHLQPEQREELKAVLEGIKKAMEVCTDDENLNITPEDPGPLHEGENLEDKKVKQKEENTANKAQPVSSSATATHKREIGKGDKVVKQQYNSLQMKPFSQGNVVDDEHGCTLNPEMENSENGAVLKSSSSKAQSDMASSLSDNTTEEDRFFQESLHQRDHSDTPLDPHGDAVNGVSEAKILTQETDLSTQEAKMVFEGHHVLENVPKKQYEEKSLSEKTDLTRNGDQKESSALKQHEEETTSRKAVSILSNDELHDEVQIPSLENQNVDKTNDNFKDVSVANLICFENSLPNTNSTNVDGCGILENASLHISDQVQSTELEHKESKAVLVGIDAQDPFGPLENLPSPQLQDLYQDELGFNNPDPFGPIGDFQTNCLLSDDLYNLPYPPNPLASTTLKLNYTPSQTVAPTCTGQKTNSAVGNVTSCTESTFKCTKQTTSNGLDSLDPFDILF